VVTGESKAYNLKLNDLCHACNLDNKHVNKVLQDSIDRHINIGTLTVVGFC